MDKKKYPLMAKISLILIQNWPVVLIVITTIFITYFFYGAYAQKARNKTKKISRNINIILNNEFSISSFLKNPEYTKQLIDNSDPTNTVVRSESGFLLRDFYIASSSKTLISRNLYNDYVGLEMIDVVLENGARLLEFDIFSSSYCDDGIPVVANSNDSKGFLYNEIATNNYISFDLVCQRVMSKAFSVSNNSDPLFLKLNLHLNKRPEKYREKIANQMALILRARLKNRLLGIDYSYQRTVLANIPIEELFGRIIILCSTGFQHTELDELVNYSWDGRSLLAKDSKAPRSLYYYTNQGLKDLGPGGSTELKILNKKGMTIVVPQFTGINVNNYNVRLAFSLGCNFIAINYSLGSSIDKDYIEKFKNYSLVLKPNNLRFIPQTITYNTCQNPAFNQTPRGIKANDPQFSAGLAI